MIRHRIRQALARLFWAIGDGICAIGDRIRGRD
jgi:hypothetical protein